MSEHTKEPWHLGTKGMEAGKILAWIDGDLWVIADTNMHLPNAGKSESRRIVACVNACTGIATETLELGGGSIGFYKAQAENERQLRKHAEQQRDELLEALEKLYKSYDYLITYDEVDDYDVLNNVQALIEKIKGGE